MSRAVAIPCFTCAKSSFRPSTQSLVPTFRSRFTVRRECRQARSILNRLFAPPFSRGMNATAVIGQPNFTSTGGSRAARIFGKEAAERLHWLPAVGACAPDGC